MRWGVMSSRSGVSGYDWHAHCRKQKSQVNLRELHDFLSFCKFIWQSQSGNLAVTGLLYVLYVRSPRNPIVPYRAQEQRWRFLSPENSTSVCPDCIRFLIPATLAGTLINCGCWAQICAGGIDRVGEGRSIFSGSPTRSPQKPGIYYVMAPCQEVDWCFVQIFFSKHRGYHSRATKVFRVGGLCHFVWRPERNLPAVPAHK